MTKPKMAPEPELLRQVNVRLIREDERERFDELLEREHYIHSARIGSQSLRYVAEAGDQWVALISFSGAAPHTKARKMKIRWTQRQRARRLGLVVKGSKATNAASWSGRACGYSASFFPSEYDTGWTKEHGRLVRWRLQRVGLSPEEAGLCGCWQFIALWWEKKKLRQGKVIEEFEEYSFYCTSAAPQQYDAARLLRFIRDHWSASENGAHYRRDVSLGEDASQISGRTRPYVMATLRNLVLGLFELQKHRGKTQALTLPGWRRELTNPQKIELITRTR